MNLRFSTEFAPTLHRLWYGGTTEDQRRIDEGITAFWEEIKKKLLNLPKLIFVKLFG